MASRRHDKPAGKGAKPPKGRPTVGRKQQERAAREAARRRARRTRLAWIAAVVLLVALIALLVATGWGAGQGVNQLPG